MTDPRIITRKCHAPTVHERYADWLNRHPDLASLFARTHKPEKSNGTQGKS